jgi:hypothetical protein
LDLARLPKLLTQERYPPEKTEPEPMKFEELHSP